MKKRHLLIGALASLITTGAHAQLLNPGLETWRSVSTLPPSPSLEAPDNWYAADSVIFESQIFFPTASFSKQVYQTTDAHSGTAAAMLITRDQDDLGVLPALLSNAEVEVDMMNFDPNNPMASLLYSGGTPVTQRVSEVSAWVKYLPKSLDNGWIYVMAVMDGMGANGDSVIGEGSVFIDQAEPAYVQKTAPISYINTVDVPDELIIIITSSTISGAATNTDSTILWVDDISMTFVTDVQDVNKAEQVVSVYPNPSNGILNLATKSSGTLSFEAYGVTGQQIAVKEFNGKAAMDLKHLSAGMYLYNVRNEHGAVVQRGKFIIQ